MPPISRRAALRAAATLGAAAVTAPAPAADRAVSRGRVKQSLCSWCFTSRGQKWSLDKLCEVAVGLGVPSVELLGAKDFPTLKKHGLVCAIASNGMGFTHGFNNPRHRDELHAKTVAAIDATAAAGFPSVIGFVGMKWHKPDDPASGEIPKDEAFRNCVAGIKAVAGHAEKAGVNLCIEHLNSRDGSDPMRGHPGYQGDDLDFVLSILRAVGSPRVKLLFDVYHVQIMHGDLLRRIDGCKEWIGHVHTAGVPGRCELDDGQEIHYPAVMRKLLRVGYAGYVGHEFIPTRDPLAGLTEAVKVCDV
jgi:hydroxypyruvate isomerase